MSRYTIAALLMLGLTVGLRAQPGDPDLVRALALEKAMTKLIQQNEGSIACILVSRSEGYGRFGQPPGKEHSGRLGIFDTTAFAKHPQYLKLSIEERRHWHKLLDFTDSGFVPRAFGSGVVIDSSGLILTNYHVVQNATRLFVRLPGGVASYADIHAADPRSDLAVLRLLNPDLPKLKAVTLGDADKLQRGQFLLTLSNPFAAGFRDGQPSASYGILSNVRRRTMNHLKEDERIRPLQYYATLLQTDSRLHLGCSGGALLNLSGEMVGLITAAAAIQGIETPGGFAIPVNDGVRRIIDVLKRGEEVEYGFLGVAFDEPKGGNGGGNGRTGVVLKFVTPGSPARVEAKLDDFDVLLAVNGQTVHEIDDVFATVGANLAGTKIRLKVSGKRGEREADVTLAKLYVPGSRIVSSFGARPYFRGMRVDVTSLAVQPPLRQYSHIPSGVYVSDVQANSAAEDARLKPGDVITHVNQTAVTNPAAFYRAIANVGREPVELTLYSYPAVSPPLKITLK